MLLLDARMAALLPADAHNVECVSSCEFVMRFKLDARSCTHGRSRDLAMSLELWCDGRGGMRGSPWLCAASPKASGYV
jgi:hypothetical protein